MSAVTLRHGDVTLRSVGPPLPAALWADPAATVQGSAFGLPPCAAPPVTMGAWVGAVSAGASVNCAQLSLVAHSSGTHTECVGHATAYVHASGDWTMITYVWMGFAALLIALVGVIAAAAAYWTGNANLSRTLSVALLVPYAIGVVLSGSALSIMSLWSPTHTTNALVRCHSKQEWGGCALSNAPKKVRRH